MGIPTAISRLCRYPPDRAGAVPSGQAMENALRLSPLAHRSAAVHKLHSAPATFYEIPESQTRLSGASLSLFQRGAVQATVTTVLG